MKCSNLSECMKQIALYQESASIGAPLLINCENFDDFLELRKNLNASQKIICVSDYAGENKLPGLDELFSDISSSGNCAVFGLSQFFMLQGDLAIQNFIAELLSFRRFKGHTLIILYRCSTYIKNCAIVKYIQQWVIFLEGLRSSLPELRFIKYREFAEGQFYEGFRQLLHALENVPNTDCALTVHVDLPQSMFTRSVYPVCEISDPYSEAAKKFNTDIPRDLGTPEQWLYMFKLLKNYDSLQDLIVSRFGVTEQFHNVMPKIFSECSENEKWLFWLAMKIFYTHKNDYLNVVLKKAQCYSQFIHEIHYAILSVSIHDDKFEKFYAQRKSFIKLLPENLSERLAFLEDIQCLGKICPHYLTDISEDEEYAFVKIIAENDFNDHELHEAASSFPELKLYMNDFIFDENNTHLREKDAGVREVLGNYFRRYKLQKIKNKIEPEFLAEVERLANEKLFYKLQPRSSLLSEVETEGTQAYFFDALGVEFLGYIEAKCRAYGLNCEVKICRCNLPSTTRYNKEFEESFTNIRTISALDDIKHHGVKFNYETCKYPLHLFHELRTIDNELRRISAELVRKKFDRALIISDHGASRLAVLQNREVPSRIKIFPDSDSNSSARFCTNEKYENAKNHDRVSVLQRFFVIADYKLIHGHRYSLAEVHGGALLEEVIIPIITIKK